MRSSEKVTGWHLTAISARPSTLFKPEGGGEAVGRIGVVVDRSKDKGPASRWGQGWGLTADLAGPADLAGGGFEPPESTVIAQLGMSLLEIGNTYVVVPKKEMAGIVPEPCLERRDVGTQGGRRPKPPRGRQGYDARRGQWRLREESDSPTAVIHANHDVS